MQQFHEYSTNWVIEFNNEKIEIQKAIGDFSVRIYHVGSTSIPEMPGKGIIDILVTISNFEHLEDIATRLSKLGYISRPVIERPESPFFTKPPTKPRSHNLHIALSMGQRERSMLAFRDFLINFPAEAKKYANKKRVLAATKPNDWEFYSKNKAFIATEIENKAVKWYKENC